MKKILKIISIVILFGSFLLLLMLGPLYNLEIGGGAKLGARLISYMHLARLIKAMGEHLFFTACSFLSATYLWATVILVYSLFKEKPPCGHHKQKVLPIMEGRQGHNGINRKDPEPMEGSKNRPISF